MAKNFFILLLITIFCSGVTYSSAINGQQILDVAPPEEKPPTEDPTHKKTEPTVVPATQPIPKANATNPQLPAGQNATLPSGPATPQVVNGNATTGSATHDPAEKPTHQTIDTKKASQIDLKNANQTAAADVNNTTQSKNGTLPGDEKNKTVTPTVAPGKINTDMPGPSQTEQTTPPSKTTAVTPAPSPAPTAAPTTAKPTVSTLSPTPVLEHNVPAPVQEKHFDGPSFIGGIVLTIGLTAIGFIAFKYYKSSKIDLNYRTL